MRQYCAYQDRCHSEVRTKIIKLKMYGDDLEGIISTLIEEDYLNEERFARSYVRGKYRMKKWGRIKIQQQLKSKYVSAYCIKKGMTEIDDEEYHNNLISILRKKNETVHDTNKFARLKKLQTFAMTKGYEYQLVKPAIAEILGTKDY